MYTFTYSFIPFTSIGVGACFGEDYISMPLYAGLVIPLIGNYSDNRGFKLKLFSDFVYQISLSDKPNGIGFDAGLLFGWYDEEGYGLGLDLRYKRINYDGKYVNSLGIGLDLILPPIKW
jgi:hypothetical protein